jgi:hypothetical protein
MKKTFVVSLLLCISALLGFGQTPTNLPTPGIIGLGANSNNVISVPPNPTKPWNFNNVGLSNVTSIFDGSGVPYIKSGDVFNGVNATNLPPVGTAATATTASNLVLGVTGDDQSLGSATLTGQRWVLSTPSPSIYIGMPGTNLFSETNILFILNDLQTNTTTPIANFTNTPYGIQPMWITIDAGCFGTRKTDWPWITNNLGSLTSESNRFPHGIQWITAAAHTNKNLVWVSGLYATNLTPPGATEWIADSAGNNLQPWTNGTGTFPTNIYGPYQPVFTPDFARPIQGQFNGGDIQELIAWGVDGLRLAECVPSSGASYSPMDKKQLTFCFSRAAQEVAMPMVNNPGYYSNAVPTRVIFTTNSPLALMVYTDPQLSSYGQSFAMGQEVRQNVTAFEYGNTQQGTLAVGARALYRDFAGLDKANHGGYVDFQFVSDPINEAMFSAIPEMGYRNDAIFGAGWNNWLFITNSWFKLINQDPDQMWPTQIPQFTTTNSSSAYKRRLANGSWRVSVYNEGSVTINPALTWDMMGWDTNLNVRITAVTPAAGIQSTNTRSYTMTTTVASYQLYQFDLMPDNIGAGQIKFVPGNAGTVANSFGSMQILGADKNSQFGGYYGSKNPSYPVTVGMAVGQMVGGVPYDGFTMNNSAGLNDVTFSNAIIVRRTIVFSNAWNLNFATNNAPNFSTIKNVSSNGPMVDIYMSNGTPFIYYQTPSTGGILP